jgi:DNA-binding transcriptional LysR family regulator
LLAFGLDPDKLQNFDVGAPLLQLQLARQGLGISFATELVVRDDLACGQLYRVPIPSQLSVRYYAVTAKGPVRPAVVKFMIWLKSITDQLPKRRLE